MNRHLKILSGSVVAVLAFLAWSELARAEEPAKRPNFVIIFTDDQGYGDVGCFGSTTIATPRLDRLAQEGLKLTSFYAQPVCGPSRSALLTARYPKRIGQGGWKVPGDEITLAEVLKTVGYTTGCIGKWDVSGRRNVKGMVPNDQGFDYFFGTLGANDRGRVTLRHNRKKLRTTEDMGELTGLYTDEAIRFIEKYKDGPFLLYLAHTMPHTKLGVSEKFRGKSKGGLYGDVIEELDYNIGRVLDTITRLGLEKNTIVWFTTDNGPWLSKGERGGSAGPLRAGKGSSWEGGNRVPAIVWGPGRVPSGKTSNALTSTLDLLPTFAALAGAKAPQDRVLDGRNQSRLITGQTDQSARETFYYYVKDDLQAVRRGKWKLALPDRTEFYGYARDKVPVTSPKLYDMELDIGEKHNVAAEHPEVVQQLLALAADVRKELGDAEPKKDGAKK
ncbi:MAG: sulfatase [Pirellulales bacterium]|nr:sulfatase [Pirellulales bacterium]